MAGFKGIPRLPAGSPARLRRGVNRQADTDFFLGENSPFEIDGAGNLVPKLGFGLILRQSKVVFETSAPTTATLVTEHRQQGFTEGRVRQAEDQLAAQLTAGDQQQAGFTRQQIAEQQQRLEQSAAQSAAQAFFYGSM